MFPDQHKFSAQANTRLYITETSPLATFNYSVSLKGEEERKTAHSLLISKRPSPKLGSVGFSDPEVVSLE